MIVKENKESSISFNFSKEIENSLGELPTESTVDIFKV